ncbi:MAG: biopolymer transporter ExbD [Cystobacterineae bacterium]|nr:biopolymer transporter ExbD [Cystobacterineae bacterium]
MATGGLDSGFGVRGRKRKPLDTTINLVPFIDLMAITISFLIMTAVWTQIGRLQVAQMSADSDGSIGPQDMQKTPVSMLITSEEARITVGINERIAIPLTRDKNGFLMTEDFRRAFDEISRELPEQNDLTLVPEDSVKYSDLVRIVDAAVGAKLTAVAISPASI